MDLTHRAVLTAALTAARSDRVVRRPKRLLSGAACAATLAALPRIACASTGDEQHVLAVVAAFAVLVALAIAAIGASIATTRTRDERPDAVTEPE
jgi:hypothetical protein